MVDEQEPEVLRETDLARKICKGEGKRYEGNRCDHFDVITWECRLLRDNPIRAVYKERCLLKKEFYARAHVFLTHYPKDLRGEDVDLEDFIFGRHDEERDHKGILDYGVDVPTISRMYGLINLSLKREIERVLKQRALIPKKRQCGNCVHRNPTEPHICQFENFPGKSGGNPFPNKHFGTERSGEDSPCDGYLHKAPHHNPLGDDVYLIESGLLGSHTALHLGALAWKDQLEQFEALLDVPVMFKAIRRCANHAETRKAADRFQRWYEDNAFIYRQLVKGGTYERAKSQYLEERFGKNEKDRQAYSTKMRRDAGDLEKCLSGKERCRELSAPEGEAL